MQVRRVQLKFHNDTDFNKIFAVMKDLGLPVSSNAPTAPPSITRPPSISPSPSLLSDNSGSTSLTMPSTLSTSLSLPHSRMTLPTYNSSSLALVPEKDPAFLDRPSSSTSVFKVPARPISSFSEPQNLARQDYVIPQRPATTSNFFAHDNSSSSHAPMAPIAPNPSSSVYIAQLEREVCGVVSGHSL